MDFLIGLLVFFLALVGFCVWRIRRQGFTWATTKRWSLYVLIALLMIGAFMACFFYATSKGIGDEPLVKWMNIFLTAAFVFGYAVKEFWQFRERWTFCGELGVLMVFLFTILERLHWEQAGFVWVMVVGGSPE